MNKYMLLIFLTLLSSISFCQNYYPYQDIKLEKPSDYKETEPLALSASNFLISTPFSKDDVNRANALKFLSDWMAGAKEHSFYTQGIVQSINNDPGLLSLYFAALVKFSLENATRAVNPMTVEHNACRIVLAYCDNPVNNFKLKKKVRKQLEDNSLQSN